MLSGMQQRRYVGVVGPGTGAGAELVEQAVQVGRLLGSQGAVVVTGGLGGVMAGAARGCTEAGGTSVGLLPGEDRAAANPYLTLALPTGLGELRNGLLVRASEVIIAVGSSWGTLSEVALARRSGVPVVLLEAPDLLDLARAELSVDGSDEREGLRAASSPREAVDLALGLLGGGRPEGWVLGVDGSRGGWVGALLPVGGAGEAVLIAGPDLRTLVDRATQGRSVRVVAVDTPIGLPDHGPRQADALARARLGRRASTVFSTPVRDALAAETYAEARAISRERTGGTSLAAQSYALRRAILDADDFVRSGTSIRVVEVHPELTFAAMAGEPLATRKQRPEGVEERLGVLAARGITLPASADVHSSRGHDLLDAVAAAWSAARVARGEAESLPDPPERFSDGLDAAIWV